MYTRGHQSRSVATRCCYCWGANLLSFPLTLAQSHGDLGTIFPFAKICCYSGRSRTCVCVCKYTTFPRFPCLFRSFLPFQLLTLCSSSRARNFPLLGVHTHALAHVQNASLHDADDDAPTSLMLCSLSFSTLFLSFSP
uniref:(northern house mosquito) hypothetical protein n=1 Tax=Culex pipiens TaxID=7175 RepID=A0A8D8JF23_CULPI